MPQNDIEIKNYAANPKWTTEYQFFIIKILVDISLRHWLYGKFKFFTTSRFSTPTRREIDLGKKLFNAVFDKKGDFIKLLGVKLERELLP